MVRLKDIIKTENILKIKPDDSLSSALSKLTTSHDAGFVFSDDEKYLGIINPYHCIIKASYPANAKVEHCVFHGPRITTHMPINKVARLFIDSKVHYLPVFEENKDASKPNKFVGIISARRLIRSFKEEKIFKVPIKEYLKIKKAPLVTVYENDLVSHTLSIFKEKKISKLVVIAEDYKLKGILSYYDLISYLISPKNSTHRGDRAGTRVNFLHLQVKNFAKYYVLTLTEKDMVSDAINLILEKRIGSIVIIDNHRHPIAIITTKDILGFFLHIKEEKKIEIISKDLSLKNRRLLGGFFDRFNFLLRKETEVKKAKLFVKEEKKGGLFQAVLSLFSQKGKPQVIKKEGKNLLDVLKLIGKALKGMKKE